MQGCPEGWDLSWGQVRLILDRTGMHMDLLLAQTFLFFFFFPLESAPHSAATPYFDP